MREYHESGTNPTGGRCWLGQLNVTRLELSMGNRLLSVAQDDSSIALRYSSICNLTKLFILELVKSMKCALSAHHILLSFQGLATN